MEMQARKTKMMIPAIIRRLGEREREDSGWVTSGGTAAANG
jgi:hypothetical protein